MSTLSASGRARNKYGSAKARGASAEELAEARNGLAFANIAQAVGKNLAGEVVLTDTQVGEIVALLRGGTR